jgi:hypothetical protein
MATLYVGPGGNDTNNGLSWANRRLTLNGIEDKPVVAGDTVYVGPGAYRETLTVDVAGSSGSPITYIGDATGEHTDGVGGVVRITGSNNDQSAVRANCINMPNARSFRTFRGFQFDGNSGHHINLQPSSSNLIVEDCVFLPCTTGSSACVNLMGTGTGHIIRRCFLMNPGPGILATHTSTVNDTGMLWENCVAIIGGVAYAFRSERVGGITVKNCTVLAGEAGMRVNIALAAGQTMQVYNCVITGCNQALVATTLGELVEDYNNVFGNNNARSNVNAGANSVSYPILFDVPFLNIGHYFGSFLATPSKWSQTAHKAGTNESSDDLYGMTRPSTSSKKSWGAVQGTQVVRETTIVDGGSGASLKLPDAGEQFFMRIPITNSSTTISLKVYREANYAGTNPQMIIRQSGQSDRTTTDAGASGQFNTLSDTFTPAALPQYVDVFVKSSNTATSGSFNTYWDTLSVS